MTRALVYSHDTFGLGNIRRMLGISRHLIENLPDLSILLVTGSPLIHSFRLPERLDYIKLPCLRRTQREQYSSKLLTLEDEEIVRLRSALILEAAMAFEPDLVLVDKKPYGINNELSPVLDHLRREHPGTHSLLVLRDIIDGPEATIRTWKERKYFEALDLYNRILVLGSPDVFDACKEYRFPPHAAGKVMYCGYTRSEADIRSRAEVREELGVSDKDKLVLVTTGGGEDGAFLLKAYFACEAQLGAECGIKSLIFAGPEIPERHRKEFREEAASHPCVALRDFTDDMLSHMNAADLVVSMGGYNTTCEILTLGKPAVVIPRTAPVEEQLIRAQRMARLGLFRTIHPGTLQPATLAEAVLSGLRSRREPVTARLDLDALPRITDYVRDLFSGKNVKGRRLLVAGANGTSRAHRTYAFGSPAPSVPSGSSLRLIRSEHSADVAPEIGYILKNYPKTSETFIANEISLLERMGMRLRIFAVTKPEGQKRHGVTENIKAPLTYLPPVAHLSEVIFPIWFLLSVPRFIGSHLSLIRLRPGPYLRAFASMLGMSMRYRRRKLAPPETLFFKEFVQAGYIALQVLRAPSIRHLHAHFGHGAATITMFASNISGVPFSFTGHAKDIYQRDLNPRDLLRKKIHQARFVVTCTRANRDYLQALSANGTRIHKVYHGLDTAKFSPPQNRQNLNSSLPPLILSVGRFVPKKGFDDLVRACRLLKDRGHEFHCLIIGNQADYAEIIKQLIEQLDLDGTVALCDAVTQEELKHFYEQATVFCLPSKIVENGDRDGIPNVLAEAMAMELPVVSTNISGIPEIVEHGTNGLLVPEKNPKALADALERVLTAPDFARSLGGAARRTICEVFDSSQNIVELKELFLSCLDRSGPEEVAPAKVSPVTPMVPFLRRSGQ